MRWGFAFVVLALVMLPLVMLSGCYMSHRRHEDVDASVVECTPVPEVASFHTVILSTSPEGCSVVGHEFDRVDVQLSPPLTGACEGSVVRTDCAVELDYQCRIPDLDTRFRGAVTNDPSTMTVISTSTWVSEPCVRTERWTMLE